MSQKPGISAIACAPGALPGGPIRTRFFDGMFLSQADLETEQRFWRLKRRLTNRALGAGVVWGLRASWNSARRSFAVTPGYALDCCGNDLVVECPVDIGEAELWTRADPALRGTRVELSHAHDRDERDARAAVSRVRHACLVLQYTECAEDGRPVHRDACGAPTSACEPSRIRETARLLLVPSPRPQTSPVERFLEELEAWRDGLPAAIRDALFPPQTSPPTTPTNALVPMHVHVTVPGAPAATTSIQPRTAGATPPVALQARQTMTEGRRTAVVTFELKPSTGWGFTAGSVFDQARLVETVTPPAALSMYWSLDLAFPPNAREAQTAFEFRVVDLEISELFGGARRGKVTLRIAGRMRAVLEGAAQVQVDVRDLVVTTERADVAEERSQQGCLRELVPWGWTAEPANGRKLAGTLLLSSLYAFLSEVTNRNSSPQWQRIATIAYVVVWYATFGVFPLANVPEEHRRKLADLILALYRRWCEAMAYPGPRCTDEHHGVYLGCATLDRSGRITAFDMWAHRRYVVTGSLLGYWADQLGLAPLDVIAGRFARAMCCLSGLAPIVLPAFDGRLAPGVGGENGERFHVGTAGSVADFASARGAAVRWVAADELARRSVDAFVSREDGRRLEVLATRLDNGGSVALAVPDRVDRRDSTLRDDITGLVRRGKLRVRERGRAAVTDFAVALLRAAPPTAALPRDAPEPTARLAERVTSAGATLADVLELGAAGTLARVGGEAADAAAADDLVDRVELAVDAAVSSTVEVVGATVERDAFRDAELQAKLAAHIARSALPRVDRDTVIAAATTAANG